MTKYINNQQEIITFNKWITKSQNEKYFYTNRNPQIKKEKSNKEKKQHEKSNRRRKEAGVEVDFAGELDDKGRSSKSPEVRAWIVVCNFGENVLCT